ncbi:MAG: hypothetical protein ACRDTB_33675, partial [Actinophytocola sp.]
MKPLARLSFVVLLGLVATLVSTVSATAAPATPPTCADPATPLTVEERRLTLPAPGEVLRRSGFGTFAERFTPALCRLPDARAAERAARTQGRAL